MGSLAVDFLDWGTVASEIASLIFLLGVTWIFPWYETMAGRAMVTLDAALAIALFPAFLHFIFGLNTNTMFFVWYYGVSLWLVAIVTVSRLGILYFVQRNGRRRNGK
jgi:hypothetical protein